MPIPQNFERAQLVDRRRRPDPVRVQPAGVLDHQDERLDDQARHRHRLAEARVRRRHAVDDPRAAPARRLAPGRRREDQGRRDQAAEDDGGGRRGGGGSGAAARDVQVGLDREPEDGRQLAAIRFAMFRPTASRPARWSTSSSPSPSRPSRARPDHPAIAGLKIHTVTDGDSLQSVAYQNYGDATRWRKIAEANGSTTRSRSAAAPSSPSRRSTPDAVAAQRPALQDRDRRSGARFEAHELRPRHQDHGLAAAARRLHRLGRLSAQERGHPFQELDDTAFQIGKSLVVKLGSRETTRQQLFKGEIVTVSPTSRPAASRWSCAPTTARTA